MKKSIFMSEKKFSPLKGSLALCLALIMLSSYQVSAQYFMHGLDLGFPAPGEINFPLDRYVEELSYTPIVHNSTYFNNWKRSAAPLKITDIVTLTSISHDTFLLQHPEIAFFKALKIEGEFSYRILLQPKGDTSLFEHRCNLHFGLTEVDCSSLTTYYRREDVKAVLQTSSFNALLRQDKANNKDVIEISQGPFDIMYTTIEAPYGSLSPQQISFKELKNISHLLVLSSNKTSINIYQFLNSMVVDVKKYKQSIQPNLTITASSLEIDQIDEIIMDEFIPTFPIVRNGKTFTIFNASENLSRWQSISSFSPKFHHSSLSEAEHPLTVYFSFPKVVIINEDTRQILEYDISNFSNITLRREYLTFGCDFKRKLTENALSDFSAGQNLLYVFCEPADITSPPYLYVYDVERNYRERERECMIMIINYLTLKPT